ncbi:transcription factor [Coprinopsis cinerea okayama7|uniref:Transcription activator of gluconeogenesis ERT1 n=1 Tax=Coprinopsis cinerea (strain Okayama-7 / 130 / ATCC MYA-4618 / FGSC 9003) TaxID=240176 RepID=ERT1_COPC7|nr:transcription factor [Coprinopsis cinerea okayama7\|eukprot:XP_001830673.1 transcription factor [Coprinopsis cinerea okayama7\
MFAVAPRPAPLAPAQAGPSTSPQQTLKKSSSQSSITSAPTKRRRTVTPEDSPQDSAPSQPQKKAREGPKKKKANRACFHCQKAHLTCDDSRPCQRCIKRGIANNCREGHRKKAKYLLDDDELEALKRSKEGAKGKAPEPQPQPQLHQPVVATMPISEPVPQSEQLLTTAFDPTTFAFGSEAANLEYSILSAILGNPSPPDSASSPPPPPSQSHYSWPSDPLDFTASPRLGTSFTSSYTDAQQLSISSDSVLSTSPSAQFLNYSYSQQQRSDEGSDLPYSQYSAQAPLHPLQPRYPLDQRPRSPPTSTVGEKVSTDVASRGLLTPPLSNASPSSIASVPPGVAEIPQPKSAVSHLQSINDRVTKPYDYTEGYHFLMKHLPTRFEKNDILRVVRALAIFRPSLIALQMPLSLDDEIFVEKCFQRSLLELGKLISYSGTPTVVWRRTGEICLVAPEFCMLTEWPMEELVGRRKYIYELFENQSVVEYWENFASHAFENTTRSVYSHCVLLKPDGTPVPATFCFSIRRDLFDLPSMVIGQWLPLL